MIVINLIGLIFCSVVTGRLLRSARASAREAQPSGHAVWLDFVIALLFLSAGLYFGVSL